MELWCSEENDGCSDEANLQPDFLYFGRDGKLVCLQNVFLNWRTLEHYLSDDEGGCGKNRVVDWGDFLFPYQNLFSPISSVW